MKNDAILLTIGIVTYKRVDKLRVLLSSLLAQTRRDFLIYVIHDGVDFDTKVLIEHFTKLTNIPIIFEETDNRINDYGHSLREIIIGKATTEYLLLTNDDNYYAPIFVEEFLGEILDNGLDIAYCDMVHSHTFKESNIDANYQVLITEPKRAKIDIGCFIVRSEIAKKVGFPDKSFDGDATFFEMCLKSKKFTVIGKIKKVLFVHN